MNFLVVASGSRRDRASLPDGWLINGAEALLEAAPQWELGGYSVYVLNRAAGDSETPLCQVIGIWREREEEEKGFSRLWYSTSCGDVRPCSRGQTVAGIRPELVSELTFVISQVSLPI